jgi:uncharacterized repeat protein (TIGR01451 family)
MAALVTAVAAVLLGFILSTVPAAQAAMSFVSDLGAAELNGGLVPLALTITTTTAAPAGASIIILASGRGDTAPTSATCTDSAGHAYTTDVSQVGVAPNFYLSSICSTHRIAAVLPAGSTLTITWTGGGIPPIARGQAFAVTGLAATPIDKTASATGTSTTPSSGATTTTTQADELLVGLIFDSSSNVAGAGFVAGTNGTTNNCATTGSPKYSALAGVGSVSSSLFSMFCIVAATGGYTAQATTSSNWNALLATYKALLAPPTIAKVFGANTLDVGGTTTLTFTLTNPNVGTPLTGVGFTDTLPAGLVVATPNGLSGPCDAGTITATPGTDTISLATATLAGGASCNFAVNVTATGAGPKNNTTTNVTSNEAGPGNQATANLTVPAPTPPSITKAFGAATINLGGTTTLSFTLTNPNAVTTLTGVGFTDMLPAGLVVATPNGLTGSCGGGAITATAGTNTISLAGATLGANASCTFTVNVRATSTGPKNNTTTNVTSNEAGPGNAAAAATTVAVPLPPTITKAFGAVATGTGGTTTLTFTISNPNTVTTLTGVGFTDTLPPGLLVATPNGLTGSCPSGTISATAGSNTISLTGATLAGGASCTFTVNVTTLTGFTGTQVNTTSPVTSIEAGPGNIATATLTVAPAPVPTLSAFGQVLVALLVVLTGFVFLRRQRLAGR